MVNELKFEGFGLITQVSNEDSTLLNKNKANYGGLPVLDDVPLRSITSQYPFKSYAITGMPNEDYKSMFMRMFSVIKANWSFMRRTKSLLTILKDSDKLTENSKEFINFLLKQKNVSGNTYFLNTIDRVSDALVGRVNNILYADFDNGYNEFDVGGGHLAGNRWNRSGKYAELVESFKGIIDGDTTRTFRTFTSISFPGFIGVKDVRSHEYRIDPLVMVTVKPELVGYVKQCLFLGEEIHPDALTIVVKKGFDHKSFIYKGLRSAYRKHILKPAKISGIEIKEVDNIQLTPITKKPEANSRLVSAQSDAEKNSFLEFTNFVADRIAHSTVTTNRTFNLVL